MRLWRQFCLMLLIFGGALLFAPQPASAFELAPAFTCSGGTASGTFLTTQDCAGEFDEERMFSYFVCQYEQILNELLSEVYCAILDQSIPAISAALTLLISLAAASFLMGVSPFNAKELMVLAAKFTLVFAFAMQADYMIGIGYQLFMTGSKEGIVYVLQYLFESGYTYETGEGSSVTVTISTISDVYHIFDQFITNIITDSTKGQMDDGSECKNALLMLIFVVSAAVPPLAIIAIYFVVRVVWMILRAIFGYCQGILGVTFLVTLAPIYVSFALFRATRPMFDKWVQYL
ncbi:MAG: hypothetical protein CMM93_01830, partial [Rickettsiales bacterium]|nr:hypothetical protein [Rickettsiales bacterium]